jgi:hypothetical protein
VLVYRTNEGRYGKCQVVKYDVNLELKWLTYDGTGNVFSKGDQLIIQRTYHCDLDAGKQCGRDQQAEADFMCVQYTAQKRAIVPENGAVLHVVSDGRMIGPTAAAQFEEVCAELKRRNPEFRGQLIPTITDGVVTGLMSQDVKPCIADISPLRGVKLTKLNLTNHSKVTDLTPLRGMLLEELSVWPFLGSDLTPLQGMPLKSLNIGGGRQKLDLAPLVGVPLEYLCVNFTQVSDLTPLKDMPLKHVEFTNTKVTDFAPLRSIRTLETINKKPAAEFWRSVEPK